MTRGSLASTIDTLSHSFDRIGEGSIRTGPPAPIGQTLPPDVVYSGIESVADDLIKNKRNPIDCGPLYHAMSGLVIFLERTAPKTPEVEQIAAANSREKPITSEKTRWEPLVAPKPSSSVRQASLLGTDSAAE